MNISAWFDGSILENARVAWAYYLLGVAGLYAFWWRITRPIGWTLVRRILRAVMLVALVCPFSVGEGYLDMAPAVLMVMLETVFDGLTGFQRVGPTFLGFLVFGAVMALVWDTLCRLWAYYRPPGTPVQRQPPRDRREDRAHPNRRADRSRRGEPVYRDRRAR